MLKRVVLGMKPGLANEPLLELALRFLAPDGELRLVSLVQIGTQEDEMPRLDATQSELDAIAERVRAQGASVTIEVQVTSLGTGLELARIAERLDADLLVIGLAKRTRVGKALLGSDAQGALMNARCPVLASHLN